MRYIYKEAKSPVISKITQQKLREGIPVFLDTNS